MKLAHVSSARHLARQSSVVVNGEVFRIWTSSTLYPSTPQSSEAVGEGAGVEEVVDIAGVAGSVVVTGALIPHSRL